MNINTPEFWDRQNKLERELKQYREFEDKFEKISKFVKQGKILDAGCGHGPLTRWLKKRFPESNIYGFDWSKTTIKICKNLSDKEHYFISDIRDIKNSNKTFDTVIASEVIEHLDIPEDGFQELLRVTKDDGTVIITTPLAEKIDFSSTTPKEHVQSFDKKRFLDMLQNYGEVEFDYFATNIIAVLHKKHKNIGLSDVEKLDKEWSDMQYCLVFLYNMILKIHSQNKVIVELGTGASKSLTAFLAAVNDSGGIVYTIDNKEIDSHWIHEPNIKFIIGDDMEIVKDWNIPIDCLFIDTSHQYKHTLDELNQWSKFVKPCGVIMLHDTNNNEVMDAIKEFKKDKYKFENNDTSNGIGILKRKKR